jgi:hypothetical protein
VNATAVVDNVNSTDYNPVLAQLFECSALCDHLLPTTTAAAPVTTTRPPTAAAATTTVVVNLLSGPQVVRFRTAIGGFSVDSFGAGPKRACRGALATVLGVSQDTIALHNVVIYSFLHARGTGRRLLRPLRQLDAAHGVAFDVHVTVGTEEKARGVVHRNRDIRNDDSALKEEMREEMKRYNITAPDQAAFDAFDVKGATGICETQAVPSQGSKQATGDAAAADDGGGGVSAAVVAAPIAAALAIGFIALAVTRWRARQKKPDKPGHLTQKAAPPATDSAQQAQRETPGEARVGAVGVPTPVYSSSAVA